MKIEFIITDGKTKGEKAKDDLSSALHAIIASCPVITKDISLEIQDAEPLPILNTVVDVNETTELATPDTLKRIFNYVRNLILNEQEMYLDEFRLISGKRFDFVLNYTMDSLELDNKVAKHLATGCYNILRGNEDYVNNGIVLSWADGSHNNSAPEITLVYGSEDCHCDDSDARVIDCFTKIVDALYHCKCYGYDSMVKETSFLKEN